MSHNLFQFIGNLTRDAEVATSDSGSNRGHFDIAVNRVWRNNAGEKQEATDYFRITAWGKLGENAAQYLGKGSKVFVHGYIKNTRYTPEGGQTVYRTDFIADEIDYLDTKAPNASNQE
ncbi:single-stranded DNA-binding protein [Xanthomonas vasicola]|uniref:Single-stranded DNA-binding protein n=1 Tax=Xanthomonas hortorum pv. vitians TaxID=83224 RepID=A0AAW8ZSR7_9XANT|nr:MULTISPECIES: single-stranded DNA-binding protein [Xanthomonas]CAD7741855.1 single-stranded DNA-binding protein [Xanthomonas hydrangeae]KGP23803.1 single-stranded DNA-binding protein [Xanthomonas citri pv. fuscans]KGR62609.1 single-stranded DNA-binding protein [Xanthomonas vasicola]KGT57564.1 single-stranded DNA-binding protein [Xanthomonas citri pv. fuscans]MDV7248897.1 single-stranded DNA-binding protein [Xanthomonas hortorum pv. vitians]